MTAVRAAPEESVTFVRRAELPALDFLFAAHTPRTWQCFNAGYSLTFADTWKGSVSYRQRKSLVTPGSVFVTVPGEAHQAIPDGAGSFGVVIVAPEYFLEMVKEGGFRPGSSPDWKNPVCTSSPALRASFAGLSLAIRSGATILELQSTFISFMARVAGELMETRGPTRMPAVAPRKALERVRDMLHDDVTGSVSLDDLASAAGLSRYHLLRSFKHHFGLPPHAYQMSERLSRSLDLLASGNSVATTAASLSFADQSHFTRHFRRQWGVSPRDYLMGAHGRTRRALVRGMEPRLLVTGCQ